AYGLARDGKTTAKSVPKNIWELAVLFQMAETYLPSLPLRVQQGLFGTLATIARWIGVEQRLRDTYL
ncbi:MAG: cupin, partial [Chloroflexota bacterium]|nr:cupin [Chloroflexota bacterium]